MYGVVLWHLSARLFSYSIVTHSIIVHTCKPAQNIPSKCGRDTIELHRAGMCVIPLSGICQMAGTVTSDFDPILAKQYRRYTLTFFLVVISWQLPFFDLFWFIDGRHSYHPSHHELSHTQTRICYNKVSSVCFIICNILYPPKIESILP